MYPKAPQKKSGHIRRVVCFVCDIMCIFDKHLLQNAKFWRWCITVVQIRHEISVILNTFGTRNFISNTKFIQSFFFSTIFPIVKNLRVLKVMTKKNGSYLHTKSHLALKIRFISRYSDTFLMKENCRNMIN